MGIPGLMSYVTQRSKTFSKEIKLRDTQLVIDGSAIACQLYRSNKCNCCFGGDYREYAYYVTQFFDNLEKCNITPIIVFDGGLEDKKFDTIITRCKQRLLLASSCTPTNEQELMPLLAMNVFIYVVRQRKVKIVQSSFEADDQIASIARILKCPVLSNDSDFFIFDVMFIPLRSLSDGIFRNSIKYGFFKHGRIYTNDDFINNFPGLDKKNLPLAAALVGNDYIDSNIFKDFFSTINISDDEKNSHYRIETILRWLQNYSLDDALAIVLNNVDPEKRESILEIIEMVINGYLQLVPSSEMLQSLGYTPNRIQYLTEALECKPYQFNRNEFLNLDNSTKSCNNTQVNKLIPAWFLHEFNAANFPGYFMSMLLQGLIFGYEQIEDYRYPACVFISSKIIKVTFRLLSSGTTNSKILKCIARGDGTDITTYELDCNDEFLEDQNFPTLENLTELSKIRRKEILVLTLRVPDHLIMDFPPAWRLYIAVIKYWSDTADKIFVTKWHLYSLILMMICHVVRKVMRSESYFEKSATEANKNQAEENKLQGQFLVDMPVKEALEKVQKTDCIKIEGFLKMYIIKDPNNFDVTIVHAFSLLQSVMKYSIFLNILLGYPYPHLNVAEFFSGTMLYNFYRDLSEYKDLNERIKTIFAVSPSILQLFISISTKIQALLAK